MKRLAILSFVVAVFSISDASVLAQAAKDPPEAAPNAPAPLAEPAPSAAAPAPSAGPVEPSAAPTEPPAGPPVAQPSPPPPPPSYPPSTGPVYQPLGRPEPKVEEGDWDPWAHAAPSGHRHDGFYLRLAIGVGGGFVAGNDHVLRQQVDEMTLTGGGLGTSIGIGGAVVDNLILNADIFQATFFNPSVEIDGADAGDADDLPIDLGVGEDVQITGLGIGVTTYLMPVNLYVAGSIGFGQVIFIDQRGARQGSDLGLGVNFMVGKEWWVGTDWGIGAALQVIVVSAEDPILGDVGGSAFNLMFSATYN